MTEKADYPISWAPVPEVDVVRATTMFLLERGVMPYNFSLPQGKGIDSSTYRQQLSEMFESVGLQPPAFTSIGPDILAFSKGEWWQIECKGAGLGKKQTQRNNFDRALASVVSYYSDVLPPALASQFADAKIYLGLSVPATKDYLKELTRRVRKPLRQKLNLWILLYQLEDKKITPVSPNHEYEEQTSVSKLAPAPEANHRVV